MSTYINHIGTYNDNHKELTINGVNSANVSNIVKTFMSDAEEIEPEAAEDIPSQPAADVWGKPKEGKYSEVRRYIEERKKGDPEFKQFCHDHTLRELCTRLTREFGWFVDDKSLGRNINRNR